MTNKDVLVQALALFNAAVDMPAADRDDWLQSQCANRQALLTTVHKMLQADGQTLAVLKTGGALPPDLIAQFAPLPKQIGRYKTVELLGEGGMGTVYLAERADGVLDQQVAIKVLKRHLASETLVRQFERERQIMANLQHPTIASLFDGGTTDDGLPYVVMEHIDGVPLRSYLASQRPNLDARLMLFQGILNGVTNAHQNLVIHRDIKPSNVLVTASGEPKLMDFGIARLLDADYSDNLPGNSHTANESGTVSMLMTPAYASPEQIRGEPLTTATDIYSLGLLLFECLADEPLVDVSGVSPLTAEKRINAASEILPSEHVKQHKPALAKQLRGDLDAIIRKSIDPIPQQRYATAAAFATDLRAFTNGEPVVAQRNTLSYRSGKFMRRHRLAVAGAALVGATVVGASLVSLNQANIADRQRVIAEQESAAARDAVDFLKAMLISVNPLTGDANAKTIDDVLETMNTELDSSFRDRPATRVLLLASAAEVYLGRGDLPQAENFAQQAVALVDENPTLPDGERAFASRVLAQVYLDQGNYPAAEAEYTKSQALYQSAQTPHWLEIASNYSDLGATLIGLSREVEAEAAYRESIRLHESAVLNRPEHYATSLSNLAGLHMDQGNYAAAEELQRQSIALFEQNPSSDGRLGMSVSNHAGTLWRLGRTAEAETEYLRGIKYLSDAAGPDHPETLIAKTSLGSLYLELKDYTKGVALMGPTAATADQTLDPDHQASSYAKNVAGQLLCETGETENGAAFLRDAVTARIRSLGADHWAVASANSSLGNCLILAGQLSAAERILANAYNQLLELRGADHHMTILAAQRLAKARTISP